LQNFGDDINKFTTHAQTHLHKIMSARSPAANHHFILIFSGLKKPEKMNLTW